MKDPETTTVFAGLDGRTKTQLPDWYRQQKQPDTTPIFAEAIRDLPQAVETTVAYQNPYTDEWSNSAQTGVLSIRIEILPLESARSGNSRRENHVWKAVEDVNAQHDALFDS